MADVKKKTSQVITLKKRISEELSEIDENLKDLEKAKKESVEKLEIKKVELKKYSNMQDICDEHLATLQEIEQASKLIEDRKTSITTLDTTIANLDQQIAKIQAEHDKAVAELEKKRRRLNDYLKYYEDLNDKLEKLIEMLGDEERKHCIELNKLKTERAKTLTRTDLSEETLNKVIAELDNKVLELNKEHGKLIDSISQKLSEITVDVAAVEAVLSTGTATSGKKKSVTIAKIPDDTETTTEPTTEPKTVTSQEKKEMKEKAEKEKAEKEKAEKATQEAEIEVAVQDLSLRSPRSPMRVERTDSMRTTKRSVGSFKVRRIKIRPTRSALKRLSMLEEEEESIYEDELIYIKKDSFDTDDDDDLRTDTDDSYLHKKPRKKSHTKHHEPHKKVKRRRKRKPGRESVEDEDEPFDFDEELRSWFPSMRLSTDLRLDLLRQGFQITPSDRIITPDDRVLTLDEARHLGLVQDEMEEEEESSSGDDEKRKARKKRQSGKEVKYYHSPGTSASTLGKASSESHICGRDIEYLKVVFGKSLTIALAEITAVQPTDPIHYLAHWMLKYRYNQEIDQITRIQIQELMIEQERLAAEKWHRELQEEARLAVLEALFRAENIIIQQDFQELQLREYEGEFDDSAPIPVSV